MIRNVDAYHYSDDKDKKQNTNPIKQNTQDSETVAVPIIENNDDKGIPIDSFEWQYKKIIIKKGLDKNNDDIIQENEYDAILDYFEVSDINKLLAKTDKSSDKKDVSGNQDNSSNKDADFDKFSTLVDPNNDVLHNDGSAAYELQNNIAGDLVMTTAAGTPFAAQMNDLYEKRKGLLKKHKDTSDIDAKITALNESVQEYIKVNRIDVNNELIENGSVQIFKYGNNSEKTGYFIQKFDFKGGNTINKNDSTDDAKGSENEENEGQNNNNQVGVNAKYSIEVLTDNLQALANIETGDNTDIQGAMVYNNTFKNGAKISFSGSGRHTIDKNNNKTNVGASVDYKLKKFSTGAYASYESREVDNDRYKEFDVEAYAKYGKTLRFAAGHSYDTIGGTDSKYNYLAAKVSGRKELKDVSLIGSVEGKYGIANMAVEETGENLKLPDYRIIAKGGFTFKSNTLKTNIFANVGFEGYQNMSEDGYDKVLTTTLVGSVATNKIDVTATLSGVNSDVYSFNEKDELISSRAWGYSSSITFTPKYLFGKNNNNIVPSITYSVSNNEDLKHYVGANLGINF